MKKASVHLLCLLFCVALFGFFNCKKADNVVIPPVKPPKENPLQEKVMATVSGRIIDENGKPVQDATVQAGGNTINTDVNGNFRLSNILLSKNAGFVLVNKQKYLTTGRTIFLTQGSVNYVEIKLIPQTLRGSFQAATGATIAIQNGSTVKFDGGSIVNSQTNIAYTGLVNVYGAYLSPEDANLQSIMPGNLTGLDSAGDLKLLQTFGMMAVELQGSNGEKLNLSPAKPAVISMPIPASLQSVAPLTIPLWHFNDTLGVWNQEGIAHKQGNVYSGNVSHFSFWNCDLPSSYVTVKLNLKNQNEQVLAGYQVRLKNTVTGAFAYGMTDSTGNVTGAVPLGVSLEMTVYNKCGELLLTKTVGPFSAASDLGTIGITTPVGGSITITGNVTDCQMAAVANGIIDVTVDGFTYRGAISNGNYTITIERCDKQAAPLDIIATDVNGMQQSSHTSLNVSSGNYTANLIACGSLPDSYVFFKIGGTNINFLEPADSIIAYTSIYGPDTITTAYAYSKDRSVPNAQQSQFVLRGKEAPGDFTIKSYDSIQVSRQPNIFYSVSTATIHVTEFTPQGAGYVTGQFSADFIDAKTRISTPGTCNFRIRH